MAATVPQQQVSAAQKLAQVNEQTWMTMGNLAEMMTDYDKAMNCYESALRHNPYSIAALSQIASLCRGREQFGRAVDYFKRILAIQENNGETWAALGHCYLMMDNLQEAYQAYQQALYHLSNPKDPKLWYGIGILYDRYGSLEHAEEAFSAVMKMDPKFEKANEIYFRLGIIYKQQQKYDLSLQCFRYILHNPPRPLTESDIWFQTGHVYEQQKEYELAKEAYERVLAENPDHAKVLQQLGWLYHQQNTSFCNQALAIQYLTRSLKADSNDAQSWYLLGRCYMAEQNYNKAYEAYQQAVYRDARNPTFWCSIGVLYYQINQYRDALDAYSRAIRLNPYISEVWYDLGTLYESCNNQVQDALDAYQRAAELDPSNPHIKQRLELLRKSQSVQSTQGTAPNAPVPQDVSNPSQYQSGQPMTGSYSQSGPSGPPSSMSAYHTALGSAHTQRAEERVPTPQLPVNHALTTHEQNTGPARDLPVLNSHHHRRSPGPYHPPYPTTHQREDVRIPDIGGGRAPTPSDRSQMNPIHDERQYQSNLPPMSMRYKEESTPTQSGSPHTRPRNFDHRLSPRTDYRYEQRPMEESFRQEEKKDESFDASVADALLSMGNPQLGQKRALPQEQQEENKKPRQTEETEPTEKVEKESQVKKEEPEEGEVDEQEEGEVKDDDDEQQQQEEDKKKENKKEEKEEKEAEEKEEKEKEEEEEGSIPPTAAVAATNAIAAATTLQQKETSLSSSSS
ncbi:uncharacterized protein B0P05DRAFT_568665 [Gilbertella persicaria]|uniref:Glucose repression mediator protein n=1 Tax=Rhizopus stolonifer TaxID=4846 RepID=A0A367KC16_RHIST|nr:uncharacterized protein B0P05DRAFT_568665 [Gilbertella persicaria]KAI8091265.1 hypothetical protein B0P05DRAFT_568665 [Gilbertella persicaria]RCH99639.1 glucose repression mediator protein [Rhizopus stolonifer]